jgi:hypothetical protein
MSAQVPGGSMIDPRYQLALRRIVNWPIPRSPFELDHITPH